MPDRISLADTDAAGVVFYPRLGALAHDAYEAALREAGVDIASIITDGSYALPVVEATITCTAPLRHGTVYRRTVSCHHMGERSFGVTIAFETDTGTAATVVQTSCAIDQASGKPIALPVMLVQALGRLGHTPDIGH